MYIYLCTLHIHRETNRQTLKSTREVEMYRRVLLVAAYNYSDSNTRCGVMSAVYMFICMRDFIYIYMREKEKI